MYRLQISFRYYLVRQVDVQERINLMSPESLATTIKSATTELCHILFEQPQFGSLIGDSMFFRFVEQGQFGPSKDPKSSEWMKWKPSLLAHYKSQFESFFSLDPQERANNLEFVAVETGMSTCRIIDLDGDKSSLFEMNSLTALRSLFITGVLLVESESPEG
jgi:hypothetical protein